MEKSFNILISKTADVAFDDVGVFSAQCSRHPTPPWNIVSAGIKMPFIKDIAPPSCDANS